MLPQRLCHSVPRDSTEPTRSTLTSSSSMTSFLTPTLAERQPPDRQGADGDRPDRERADRRGPDRARAVRRRSHRETAPELGHEVEVRIHAADPSISHRDEVIIAPGPKARPSPTRLHGARYRWPETPPDHRHPPACPRHHRPDHPGHGIGGPALPAGTRRAAGLRRHLVGGRGPPARLGRRDHPRRPRHRKPGPRRRPHSPAHRLRRPPHHPLGRRRRRAPPLVAEPAPPFRREVGSVRQARVASSGRSAAPCRT